MPERSFVTGATGQIGRPLVAALVAAGHRVTALVRKPSDAAALGALGAATVVGDLDSGAVLAAAVAEADHVWHLAGGLRGPGRVDADVLNRAGTEQLAAALAPHAARLRSVTFASTCAVYGDRSGLWVTEDYPPAPQTEYGTAKVAAERALQAIPGLPLRVVRVAAVYGPGLRFMQEDAVRRGRAWLPGEGRNHVPVVHIDDCVAALVAIGTRGEAGVWNLAAPGTPSLKEFYAEVSRATGAGPVRFWSTWIPSAIQTGAARQNERLMRALGRKARFTNDNLRLFTASVRLRVDRLEKELGFVWRYADHRDGVRASIVPAA